MALKLNSVPFLLHLQALQLILPVTDDNWLPRDNYNAISPSNETSAGPVI